MPRAPRAVAAPAARGTERPVQRVRRPPPYVRCLERIGRLGVWLVDGAYVRETADDGFGAFGHHFSYTAIPRNEIWLEVEMTPDEQRGLLRHALIERRLMARGMDYEAARTMAIAEERRTRAKAGRVGERPPRSTAS
jgi:hypothetical protein